MHREDRLAVERLRLGHRARQQRTSAGIKQEHPARRAKPVAISQDPVADEGEAESGDDAEDGVGRGGAEAR